MVEKPSPWAHPFVATAIGLLAVPLAKLLWVPNYVFNFLTTLVHECGHALFAWLTGRLSIPAISLAGGGATAWGDPHFAVVLMIDLVPVYFAWKTRADRMACGLLAAASVLYPIVAWFGVDLLPIAGGVLLEVIGAAACFFVVFGVDLRRPFERPLYALWGWFLLINRGTEAVLMLQDWDTTRVIAGGLAAGLEEDLHRVQAVLGWTPQSVMHLVLAACVVALPVGALAGWWRRRFAVED